MMEKTMETTMMGFYTVFSGFMGGYNQDNGRENGNYYGV